MKKSYNNPSVNEQEVTINDIPVASNVANVDEEDDIIE